MVQFSALVEDSVSGNAIWGKAADSRWGWDITTTWQQHWSWVLVTCWERLQGVKSLSQPGHHTWAGCMTSMVGRVEVMRKGPKKMVRVRRGKKTICLQITLVSNQYCDCWKEAEAMKLTKLRSDQVKWGKLSEVKQNARGCNEQLVFCVP